MKQVKTVALVLLFAVILACSSITAWADGWTDAYSAVLDEMNTAAGSEPAGSIAEYSYLLYDIDKDGTPELITKTGTCEADYVGTVYLFKDGKAERAGDFGLGHTALYTDPEKNGVILWWAQMGAAGATRYSLLNENLVSEQLFDEVLDIQNNPDAEYTPVDQHVPGAEALEFYPAARWLSVMPYDKDSVSSPASSEILKAKDAAGQLQMIADSLDSFRQDESTYEWYYTVSDLDHNGCLEIIAASMHHEDRSTNMQVWEVNPSGAFFEACSIPLEDGETFPDIISENADTYYDKDSDTWSYLFYDNIWPSADEAYSVKCSVVLKDRELSYEAFATQHVESNGHVSFQDRNGAEITADAYNAAGMNAFAGKDRSNTHFDWFRLDEKATAARLTDSYSIFTGEKAPDEISPVPTPSPAPAPQPAPDVMIITKNPTNEYHEEGETAWFIASATTWETLRWTFIGSNGVEYSASDFQYYYPNCWLSGDDGPNLCIGSVSEALDGWSVYCTFYYKGQVARTSAAYLFVQPSPFPPTPGEMDGTVTEALMSTVTIYLENGQTLQVLRDVCQMSGGTLSVGCPCTVYYEGNSITRDSVTLVIIYGNSEPDPEYISIDGTVSALAQGIVAIQLDNGVFIQVGYDICISDTGIISEGDRCTVDFLNNEPVSVEVYGQWDDGGDDIIDDDVPIVY